jgi:cell division protein FtsB
MVKAQWDRARLRRQIAKLEEDNAVLERRIRELESQLPQPTQAPLPALEEKPYVGLKTLLTGGEERKP